MFNIRVNCAIKRNCILLNICGNCAIRRNRWVLKDRQTDRGTVRKTDRVSYTETLLLKVDKHWVFGKLIR